jgi:hypothetical protein
MEIGNPREVTPLALPAQAKALRLGLASRSPSVEQHRGFQQDNLHQAKAQNSPSVICRRYLMKSWWMAIRQR